MEQTKPKGNIPAAITAMAAMVGAINAGIHGVRELGEKLQQIRGRYRGRRASRNKVVIGHWHGLAMDNTKMTNQRGHRLMRKFWGGQCQPIRPM